MSRSGSAGELPQALVPPDGCPAAAEPVAWLGTGSAGVLLLHGLTGSPSELLALAQACRDARLSVAMPILAGHGTDVRALAATTWRDWRSSAEDALAWLSGHCQTVHIVGFSMGALLAMLLAAEQAPRQRGRVVLLAPALALSPLQRRAVTVLGTLGVLPILGSPVPLGPDGSALPRYTRLPLQAVHQLVQLQDYVVGRIQPLAQPVLVLHGDRDRTIDAARAMLVARQVLGAAPDMRLVQGAGHLLVAEATDLATIGQVMEFLTGH